MLFLPDATAHDWVAIFDHAEPRRLYEGDAVTRAGEEDRALYLLVEGRVNVHGSGPAYKTVEAPSVLGEVAFLDGGPRSVTLMADTDVEVVRFGLEAFESLAAADPALATRMALDLGRIAAIRLRLLSEKLEP